MKIDFDHVSGNAIADLTIENLEEEKMLNIVKALNPEFSKDGNQYCYLYGKDLQEGIAGFGDTAYEAMRNFWIAFCSEKIIINKQS